MLKFVTTEEGPAVLLLAVDPNYPNEPKTDFPFLLAKLIRLQTNGDYVLFHFPKDIRISVYIRIGSAQQQINTVQPRLLVRLARGHVANRKKIRKYNPINGNPVTADNFEINVEPAYKKVYDSLFIGTRQTELQLTEEE